MSAVVDGLCLGGFVLAGRQSHGLDNGPGWFIVVAWPIVVGWFSVALPARLYTSASRPWIRLATTVGAGVGLGLALRSLVTHRETPFAFVVVAYAVIALATSGWRLAAAAVSRRRATGAREGQSSHRSEGGD